MALLVVEGDPVEGTDTHNLSGVAVNAPAPPPTLPWVGTGRFAYVGAVTGALSPFVSIDGTAAALTTSTSALDPGEAVPPSGRHSGPQGSSFVPAASQPPTAPTPNVDPTLLIIDPIGTGTPSSSAGSAFVKVDGTPVLLDADAIDTCDGQGAPENSTVTASTQDFVAASE